jgi:hypothetical protein
MAGGTHHVVQQDTAQDALWMRHLLPELGFPLTGPFEIQCDSKAYIALIRNLMCTNKAKHIDILHHFVRESGLSS